MPKLTLTDITDLRAYERERDDFRRQIIDLKRKRRLPVGDFVTLVFENRATIRFQIQEMARVEKLMTDEAIEAELRIYNPLVPEPGELRATLFIELTSEEALREWLPKLVGIETAPALRLSSGKLVPAAVDEEHSKQLTRDEVTASVHYVGWQLTPEQIDDFAAGPVQLEIHHPSYQHAVELGSETHKELLRDLHHGG